MVHGTGGEQGMDRVAILADIAIAQD